MFLKKKQAIQYIGQAPGECSGCNSLSIGTKRKGYYCFANQFDKEIGKCKRPPKIAYYAGLDAFWLMPDDTLVPVAERTHGEEMLNIDDKYFAETNYTKKDVEEIIQAIPFSYDTYNRLFYSVLKSGWVRVVINTKHKIFSFSTAMGSDDLLHRVQNLIYSNPNMANSQQVTWNVKSTGEDISIPMQSFLEADHIEDLKKNTLGKTASSLGSIWILPDGEVMEGRLHSHVSMLRDWANNNREKAIGFGLTDPVFMDNIRNRMSEALKVGFIQIQPYSDCLVISEEINNKNLSLIQGTLLDKQYIPDKGRITWASSQNGDLTDLDYHDFITANSVAELKRISSMAKTASLGSMWITPDGEVLKGYSEHTHFETLLDWANENPEKADSYAFDYEDGEFMDYTSNKLIEEGFIYIQAYSDLSVEAIINDDNLHKVQEALLEREYIPLKERAFWTSPLNGEEILVDYNDFITANSISNLRRAPAIAKTAAQDSSYWILPDGEFIGGPEWLAKHIDLLIDWVNNPVNAEKAALYGPFEGNEDELVEHLLKTGWIRIYAHGAYIAVQAWNLTEKNIQIVQELIFEKDLSAIKNVFWEVKNSPDDYIISTQEFLTFDAPKDMKQNAEHYVREGSSFEVMSIKEASVEALYWILPDGLTIGGPEWLENHIGLLADWAIKKENRDRVLGYGITFEEIRNLNAHKEGKPFESGDLNQVFDRVLMSGWVRVIIHGSYVDFTTWTFNDTYLHAIQEFIVSHEAADRRKTGWYPQNGFAGEVVMDTQDFMTLDSWRDIPKIDFKKDGADKQLQLFRDKKYQEEPEDYTPGSDPVNIIVTPEERAAIIQMDETDYGAPEGESEFRVVAGVSFWVVEFFNHWYPRYFARIPSLRKKIEDAYYGKENDRNATWNIIFEPSQQQLEKHPEKDRKSTEIHEYFHGLIHAIDKRIFQKLVRLFWDRSDAQEIRDKLYNMGYTDSSIGRMAEENRMPEEFYAYKISNDPRFTEYQLSLSEQNIVYQVRGVMPKFAFKGNGWILLADGTVIDIHEGIHQDALHLFLYSPGLNTSNAHHFGVTDEELREDPTSSETWAKIVSNIIGFIRNTGILYLQLWVAGSESLSGSRLETIQEFVIERGITDVKSVLGEFQAMVENYTEHQDFEVSYDEFLMANGWSDIYKASNEREKYLTSNKKEAFAGSAFVLAPDGEIIDVPQWEIHAQITNNWLNSNKEKANSFGFTDDDIYFFTNTIPTISGERDMTFPEISPRIKESVLKFFKVGFMLFRKYSNFVYITGNITSKNIQKAIGVLLDAQWDAKNVRWEEGSATYNSGTNNVIEVDYQDFLMGKVSNKIAYNGIHYETLYRGDTTEIPLSEMDPIKIFKPGEREFVAAFANTPGLYFTDDIENAQSYGEYITKVEIKDGANILDTTYDELLDELTVRNIVNSNPNIDMPASNWSEDTETGIEMIVETIMDEDDLLEQLTAIWAEAFPSGGDDLYAYINAMTQNGIDGIKVNRDGHCNHFIIYNKDAIEEIDSKQSSVKLAADLAWWIFPDGTELDSGIKEHPFSLFNYLSDNPSEQNKWGMYLKDYGSIEDLYKKENRELLVNNAILRGFIRIRFYGSAIGISAEFNNKNLNLIIDSVLSHGIECDMVSWSKEYYSDKSSISVDYKTFLNAKDIKELIMPRLWRSTQAIYNSPVKTRSKNRLIFTEELTASYSGQKNLTISAHWVGDSVYDQSKIVGHLDYVEYNGEPSISNIYVDPEYRRKGIGSDLVKYLQSEYPDKEIDWGMTTDNGTGLKEFMDKNGRKTEARSDIRGYWITPNNTYIAIEGSETHADIIKRFAENNPGVFSDPEIKKLVADIYNDASIEPEDKLSEIESQVFGILYSEGWIRISIEYRRIWADSSDFNDSTLHKIQEGLFDIGVVGADSSLKTIGWYWQSGTGGEEFDIDSFLVANHVADLSYRNPNKQAGFFDAPQEHLIPELWLQTEPPKLLPEIKEAILGRYEDLMSQHYKSPMAWTTFWLFGSSTSYQWYTPGRGNSDTDVNLTIDYNRFRAMNKNSQLDEEIRAELIHLINFYLDNAPLGSNGNTVQYYIRPEDANDELFFEFLISINQGVYDIEADNWVVPSAKLPNDWNPEDVFPGYVEVAKRWKLKLDSIYEHYLAHQNDEEAFGRLHEIFEKLHDMRRESYSPGGGGNFGEGNFVWQYLHEYSYLETVVDMFSAYHEALRAREQELGQDQEKTAGAKYLGREKIDNGIIIKAYYSPEFGLYWLANILGKPGFYFYQSDYLNSKAVIREMKMVKSKVRTANEEVFNDEKYNRRDYNR